MFGEALNEVGDVVLLLCVNLLADITNLPQ